jgi:hypothetical protein
VVASDDCCNIAITLIDPVGQFSMSVMAWFQQSSPNSKRRGGTLYESIKSAIRNVQG